MNAYTLRVVLLVSSAHALVHIYELTLPSVELQIAGDYSEAPRSPGQTAQQAGKRRMGLLSTCWRMPFGFGALAAGLAIDRWGSRRMLLVYLVGCSLACLAASFYLPLPGLFVVMSLMGGFACIYHPAGLTLISLETAAKERARALGLHGIFGSAGIALAPLLVAVALSNGASWRSCYLLLAVPGGLLAILLTQQWRRHPQQHAAAEEPSADEGDTASFLLLTALTVMQGFVYAGVMSFLTRYLSGSPWAAGRVALASYASSLVLALGCIGQYAAGRFARLPLLERQLLWVTVANVPLLMWMAVAEGNARLAAAGAFSIVHFMHQPLYNSLVAQYTTTRRRSLAYGFSFAMSFGLGAFGATWVGFSPSERQAYLLLAIVAAVSSCCGGVLVWSNRQSAVSRAG